jgi:8-oxo-dGTP diphosphatase
MAKSNPKSIVCSKPHVVVAVFIIKDGKVLLGKRINAIGHGTWGPPGGKLEFGEEVYDCAKRETFEETGLKIKNLRLGCVVNDYSLKDKWHFTSVCLVADYVSGTATRKEPNRCAEWRWIDWNKMPTPLFSPMKQVIKQKFNPLEK